MLIPVCNSMFDRESASACIAELGALPRLSTGRCKLGVVGMRVDGYITCHGANIPRPDPPCERIQAPRPASLMPAQESLVHGSRLCVFSPSQPLAHAAANTLPMTRLGHEAHNLDAPRFLLRQL